MAGRIVLVQEAILCRVMILVLLMRYIIIFLAPVSAADVEKRNGNPLIQSKTKVNAYRRVRPLLRRSYLDLQSNHGSNVPPMSSTERFLPDVQNQKESTRYLIRPKRFKSHSRFKIYECSLHLVADYLFYKNIGHSDEKRSRKILFDLISETNNIFKKNFKTHRIKFIIENVTVLHNHRFPDNYTAHIHTPMTADEFLLKASLFNFSSVCLGIIFTYKDFVNTIGATFAKNLSGPYFDAIDMKKITTSRLSQFSFNTVVLSSLNSQEKLNRDQLLLALVHHLEYSLGSGYGCASNDDMENFEKFTKTTNPPLRLQVKMRQYKFSNCPKKNILMGLKEMSTCLCCKNVSETVMPVPGRVNKEELCSESCCSIRLKKHQLPNDVNDKNDIHEDLLVGHILVKKFKPGKKKRIIQTIISDVKNTNVYLPIFFAMIFLSFIIFIIWSLCAQYTADDSREMKAMRYSKMLRALAVGDLMTTVYRAKIVRANKLYCRLIHKSTAPVDVSYTEALARLQILFPHVPFPYLQRVVQMSANENVAVRLLLIHGYPMRTFSETKTGLVKLMKNVVKRYKK